jgi:hypothetical protein
MVPAALFHGKHLPVPTGWNGRQDPVSGIEPRSFSHFNNFAMNYKPIYDIWSEGTLRSLVGCDTVVWWLDNNVSEDRAASIFRVEVRAESESLYNWRSVIQSVRPSRRRAPSGTHDQMLIGFQTITVVVVILSDEKTGLFVTICPVFIRCQYLEYNIRNL